MFFIRHVDYQNKLQLLKVLLLRLAENVHVMQRICQKTLFGREQMGT